MTDTSRFPEIQNEWQAMLAEHDTKVRRWLRAAEDPLQDWEEQNSAAREYWRYVSRLLRFRADALDSLDLHLLPTPDRALSMIAHVAGELSDGHIPKIISDSALPGRPYWRYERQDIAYAILYIEAVRRGEIHDQAFNKPVRDAYDVTGQTVRNWLKRREQICVDLPLASISPEELKSEMLRRGERYTRLGRGAPGDL